VEGDRQLVLGWGFHIVTQMDGPLDLKQFRNRFLFLFLFRFVARSYRRAPELERATDAAESDREGVPLNGPLARRYYSQARQPRR